MIPEEVILELIWHLGKESNDKIVQLLYLDVYINTHHPDIIFFVHLACQLLKRNKDKEQQAVST